MVAPQDRDEGVGGSSSKEQGFRDGEVGKIQHNGAQGATGDVVMNVDEYMIMIAE